MRNHEEKVVYLGEKEETVIDEKTGEVITQHITSSKTTRLETEPPYVKLYLDCLFKFKDIQLSFNPILSEFLKRASYADDDDSGQIIYTNKAMKKKIAEHCGVSCKRVEQALTEFVKKGIFKRLELSCYQVNPYLFGKGEWKEVRKIRATFDFNTGEAIADLVSQETTANDNNTPVYTDV